MEDGVKSKKKVKFAKKAVNSFSFREVLNAIPEIDYICVDVANGYSEHFVEFVRLVRKEFPDRTIFVRLFERTKHAECETIDRPSRREMS